MTTDTTATAIEPLDEEPVTVDDAAVARVGIHWATEQCRDLLDHQVRGLHFYTLNKSDATRQIYEYLGVKDSVALR